MSVCPSDEELTNLLADTLSTAERDTLAQHVEACAACQDRLAHLTATLDTEMWRRAEQPPQDSRAEVRMMRRLKRLPSWLPVTVPRPEAGSAGSSLHTGSPRPAVIREPPDVPGYKILGELGRGGMGVVYQARQLGLQRTVALKMLLTGFEAGAKDLARFRVEAAAIARPLQHPNIVQIYDVGEAAGRPYFVLEFVAGGSLAQYLRGTPQPVRPAAQLVETLARAIHAAHASSVIHRDLKPANILLHRISDIQNPKSEPESTVPAVSDSGFRLSDFEPKVTDFGVAKCTDGKEASPDLRGPTVTGELVGTPSYMAPEQTMGPRQPVGPAADVYALGAILYELLTGRPPFTGETPLATLLQVVHNEPVPLSSLQPSVPRDLETICLKCLRKEPRQRYSSALELAEDVRTIPSR